MKHYLLFLAILLPSLLYSQKEYRLSSPNKRLNLKVNVGTDLSYNLSFDGKIIVFPSQVNLTIDNKPLCFSPTVKDSKKRSIDELIHPVYGKFQTLKNKYNELTVTFKENFSISFRLYNEGFAYRFNTTMDKEIVVNSEQADF